MTDTMIEEVREAIFDTLKDQDTDNAGVYCSDVGGGMVTLEGVFSLEAIARAAIAAIIPEGSVVVPREDLDSKFCHRCANDQIDRAKFREMFPEKEPWTPDMIQAAEGDPT